MTAEETRHAEFLLSMLASSYLMAAIETQRHNLDCRGAMKYLRDDIRNAIFEFEYPAQVWAPIVAIEQDAANFTSCLLYTSDAADE